MVFDRRERYELVQALLRARNKKYGVNLLENVAQTGTASRDGSYGEPTFGGMRFSPASQPGMTTSDKTESQSHQLVPTPRPHPFRGLASSSHTGGAAGMAEARGVHAQDQLSFKAVPSTLWLANLQTSHGPRAPRAAILRLADGDPYMAKEAPHREKKMPKVRYPTSGEIWSEFLGGIGKGIAQSYSDILNSGAKARLGTFGGVYIDTPNPILFEPPTSPWDDTGRKIAPGVMAVTGPAPFKGLNTWRFKIGQVRPPKDLKPGTVSFGNSMHMEIVKFVNAKYPGTIFRISVKPGQKGIDMEYLDGPYPGFKYLDIKPNKTHSQKQLNTQIEKWGYEGSIVKALSYDEQGNIYDGFSE